MKAAAAPVFQNPAYAEAYAIMRRSAEKLRKASQEEKLAWLKEIGALPKTRERKLSEKTAAAGR